MALTYPTRQLSTSAREALYNRCKGDNEFPTCNICGLPVDGTRQAWDESHDPDLPPRAWGGTVTGVAHRDCNRRHGAEVVVPMIAKTDRVRQRFNGSFKSRHKLPGGRDSRIKIKIGGGVVARPARFSKMTLDECAELDRQLEAVSATIGTACERRLAFIEQIEDLLGSPLTDGQRERAEQAFLEGETAVEYALSVKAEQDERGAA